MVRSRSRVRWSSVLAAVLGTALVTGARHLLVPVIGYQAPFLLYVFAVVFAGTVGGFAAGMLATVLSLLVGLYMFVEPPGQIWPTDPAAQVHVVLFLVTGIFVSQLCASLRRARIRAEGLLQSIQESFYRLDRRWRFTYLNRQAEEYFSMTRAQVLGGELWSLFPLTRGTTVEREFRRALEERVTVDFEIPSPSFPGRWVSVRATGDESGLSVSFRDVTERHRVQEELRATARQLRLITDALPVLVSYVDREGRYRFNNRAYEQWFGLSPAELEGRGLEDVLGTEAYRQIEPYVRIVLDRGMPTHFESVLPYAHGGAREVDVLYVPDLDESGSARGFFVMVTDVTAARRAQRELGESAERLRTLAESERAARAEAERHGRLKDEFVATLSHELRTPLNAILGWAQLLQRSGPIRADVDDGLEVIQRNARVQAQLISDLLDVSRMISGNLRLEVQPLDLGDIVEATLLSILPAAEEKGLRIHKPPAPCAGKVLGDPARLQQVVWNLLSNAVKFTRRNGTIRVELERAVSRLELRVSDDGQGIRSEFLPHVFDRFRQSDASTTRHAGGLGLGLAIVKQLVELHGGTVRADSPGEGRGAAFTVSLPVMAVNSEENALPWPARDPAHAGETAAAAVGSLDGVKVLMVDDEQDARELVRRVLERCGAEVETAASAKDALELIPHLRPDVLVSDIGMPEHDGYELIRNVRSLGVESGGAVPAVALTAYARVEDRLRALRSGYQTHITKPIEASELVATIESLSRLRVQPLQESG